MYLWGTRKEVIPVFLVTEVKFVINSPILKENGQRAVTIILLNNAYITKQE